MMKADSIAARDELDRTSFLIDREFINAQKYRYFGVKVPT